MEDLSRATSRQLLSRANESARIISGVAGGPTSKLNKADLSKINSQLGIIMEVVAHLGLIAETGKKEVSKAHSKAEATTLAWERECARVAKAEAEAARAAALAATTRASEAASAAGPVSAGLRAASYAEKASDQR
ncbi:unnamed protein product [Diatraea saccharalis]|uniref:Uncharacterized protein n=1 Tax=Diatraea saccharalis TaxID=40085 RepID=A0A9N9WG39_9NEOP|nr:unnamed protein product [Diatraea saccharalis]